MNGVSLAHAVALRFGSLLDRFFPPRCCFCRALLSSRDQECFCPRCHQAIRLVSHPLCPACGRPFLDTPGEDHLCGACLGRDSYFLQARAWACYPREEDEDHPLRHAVQQFKYGRRVSLGKPLGRLMARGCHDFFRGSSLDVIVPVPLHPRRLRWRGFNQSVILAREVGRSWQLPMDPFLLLRSRETPPQIQLPEKGRRRNVRGAFALNPDKPVEAKTILLLDDVYTSGATVNECSRVLVRAGAREVHVLTLARTV